MVHKEIQYRLFSNALSWVASQTYKPRFNSLERTLKNVLSGQPQTLHGCFIDIKKTAIRITREFNAVADTWASFDLGCIWDKRWRFLLRPGRYSRARLDRQVPWFGGGKMGQSQF